MSDKSFYLNYNNYNNKISDKYTYNNISNNNSNNINNLNFSNIINDNIKMIPKLWTTIIPNLYVSNIDIAIDNNFLINKNITLIINLCQNINNNDLNKSISYKKDVKIHNVNYLNHNNTNKLISIIYDYIQKNLKVLVFCETGYEKSDILVTCFLCKYTKLNKKNVINCIKSKNDLFFSKNKDTTLIDYFDKN